MNNTPTTATTATLDSVLSLVDLEEAQTLANMTATMVKAMLQRVNAGQCPGEAANAVVESGLTQLGHHSTAETLTRPLLQDMLRNGLRVAGLLG